MCGAPVVLAPGAAQSVGGALRVRTRGAACATATKCYLDGDPTPVAGAGAGDVDAPVAAAVGDHVLACNSWDAGGHVYTSPARAFTVVACGAPAILSPAMDESVASAVVVETSAPACLGTTKCYLDGNPAPVASGTGNVVATVTVGAGAHGISCNGWDASGKVYLSATTAFVAGGGTACPAGVSGASLAAHNTSASPHYDRAHFGANFGTATWISQSGATQPVDPAREDVSNNPITPGHVSAVDVHRLVPSRPDLRWFAHVVPWFRAGGGGGHVDIGVDNTSGAWIAALLEDLHRRGFDGVVIDWYGQGSYTDQATLAMQAYLRAHPDLGLSLIVMIDKGVANLSQSVLATQIQYVKTQYMSDALYERDGGKPILMFFGVLDKLGATAMAAVKAQVGAGQSWVLQGTGVLTYAWVDQAFDWAAPYHDGLHPSDPYNLGAVSGFYAKLAATPAKRGFGALAPGFNGMLTHSVGWSQGKYLPRGNGACLVQRAARTDAVIPPNVTRMQVVTWNDWEEGSQVETGVENFLAVHASVDGGSLAWAPAGDESTVDHYDIYVSSDGGATAHRIGSAPRGARSFPLASACVAHGAAARAAVVAVGRPLIRDHASGWVGYSAP